MVHDIKFLLELYKLGMGNITYELWPTHVIFDIVLEANKSSQY